MKTYHHFKFGTIQEWKAEKDSTPPIKGGAEWLLGIAGCVHHWVYKPLAGCHVCSHCHRRSYDGWETP